MGVNFEAWRGHLSKAGKTAVGPGGQQQQRTCRDACYCAGYCGRCRANQATTHNKARLVLVTIHPSPVDGGKRAVL